ncbi:MAG: M48 family metalloprotease [Pseudomonadota bacterium]|nr:M48 family metalloprotease [Pseudomonadota bacterium]
MAVLLLVACGPAAAQFDFGRILNKTIETTKKFQEANKEFSTEDEIALGNGITAGVLGATKLHPDQNLQRYVNRIGKWLAMHSERADLPWSFGVMDTETINAFAMPGGAVLVSHGLVKRLASEAELAGVLAHEIAHVVKKHQLAAIQSTLSSDVWAGMGKDAAGQAIGRRGGGDAFGLKSAAANAGVEAVKSGVFLRPLDRGMEYEADRMGVVIAARSGYDPYGLVAVLSMLAQVKGDGSGAAIFDTHPAASDRIAELEGFMAKMVERYASQPQVEGRFRQIVGK